MKWEEIFANHIPEKGLISKKFTQLNNKAKQNKNNLIKKMGRGNKQTILQRRHTNG